MAMVVKNNVAAQMALGELRKNNDKLSKDLKQVASGMKINGAGDGASEYAISEKMRVRIRALGQDDENTKKGSDMLHLAEGGIQNQISILRTIKQKVIDANNDTNTETDRMTIQKEINQGYRQLQDIATDTDYNGRRVLLEGNQVVDTIKSWEVKPAAVQVEGSEIDGILTYRQHEATLYDTLDGQPGPFDTFYEWEEKGPTTGGPTIASLGLDASNQLANGVPGTPNTITVDLAVAGSGVDQLDNVGFAAPKDSSYYTYVLTKDKTRDYSAVYHEIDISGCSTLEDVARQIASSVSNSYVQATAAGTKVTFTTLQIGTSANSTTVAGISRASSTQSVGGSPAVSAYDGSPAAAATGVFGQNGLVTAGKDTKGTAGVKDLPYSPGNNAQWKWNIASVPDGSGAVFQDRGYGRTLYLKFTDGSDAYTYSSVDNIATVGRMATADFDVGRVHIHMSGGAFTATTTDADYGATIEHSFSVTDGFAKDDAKSPHAAQPAVPPHDVTYTAVSPLAEAAITNNRAGTDGTPASYTIDLSKSEYQTSDETELEKLITDLTGKAIYPSDRGRGVEFIDSAAKTGTVPSTASLAHLNDNAAANSVLGVTTKIFGTADLDTMRTAVKNGATIAAALASLMQSAGGIPVTDANDPTKVTGVRFEGDNTDTVDLYEGELRHYDIDFGKWLQSHPDAKLPDDLDNKGFRAYCATDNSQWFNFLLLNGTSQLDNKPASGTASQDIKTIIIDISKVTDVASLVTAIYDQAEPKLEGSDPSLNHLMRLAGQPDEGVLTLYDERRFPVNTYPDHQSHGAKIAAGVMDNVIMTKRKVYSDALIIQDTDKANLNICIKIPRTTIDHILGYVPGSHTPEEYNVMTRESRESLLGVPPDKGTLDKGLDYLIDANTLIGAQVNRLQNSNANITTNLENTQASESVIRDADMAKAMTSLIRSNILSQSAQAMLAQANQQGSSVLNLLQG